MSEAVQTLGKNLPKILGDGNSATVWVKTASSAATIVFLDYNTMWCGASVKWDVL